MIEFKPGSIFKIKYGKERASNQLGCNACCSLGHGDMGRIVKAIPMNPHCTDASKQHPHYKVILLFKNLHIHHSEYCGLLLIADADIEGVE